MIGLPVNNNGLIDGVGSHSHAVRDLVAQDTTVDAECSLKGMGSRLVMGVKHELPNVVWVEEDAGAFLEFANIAAVSLCAWSFLKC